MAILNDLLVNGISRFAGSITADEIRGLGANYYGVCDTAAATGDKVVTCAGFVLKAGARISIKFTNGNTTTSILKLNVNSTGLKEVRQRIYNDTMNMGARCYANAILDFIYDGTYWIICSPYNLRNNFTYTTRPTSANRSYADLGLEYILATSSMTTGKPPTDAHILNFNWDNGTTHSAQLAIGHGTSGVIAGRLFTRGQPDSSTWSNWLEVPRLSGALTNNQIVVSDESTGQALLKGGPTIGTGTTKFLREDGTWQTPNGTGTPYIDLGSAALSTGTSTTTGMSYTLTFTSATSALSSVTAPTIVMFTTIIDGAAAAFVGQYTKDLVVSPTTFKQIVGTCVMGTETKTFRVSIVPGMTTGSLLIDDVANIWRKTTSGGIVYPTNNPVAADYNIGNVIIFGADTINGDDVKTSSGTKGTILLHGNITIGLNASTPAASTSYVFPAAANLALPDGNLSYITNFLFSTPGQNTAAQKPTSITMGTGITLNFASSINPSSAASSIQGGIDASGSKGSLIIGNAITTTAQNTFLMGNFIYNTGTWTVAIGQGLYNTAQSNFILGSRNKSSGNRSLIIGTDHLSTVSNSVLLGKGHDTTNGIANIVAVGQYSSITSTSAFVIGNGTATDARSNAFEVHTDGRATVGAAPTADMDVATKKYVDDNSGGGGGGGTTYVYHGTCETAAATTEKAVTCSEFTSDKLVLGATIFVTFTATNSAAVGSITLNVNSTGAKNIKYLSNAAVSNLPNTGYIIANMTYCFVYNGTYWVMTLYYNTNDQAYNVRHYYMNRYASQAISSYKVMLLDKDGKFIPYATTSGVTTYTKTINTTAFNPFAGIFWKYYDSNTSAGAKVGDAQGFNSYTLGYGDVRYSFNINSSGTAGTTALTSNTPIFIKAKYDFSTGLATLVPNSSSSNYLERSSIVQALPTTNPNDSSNFYIYIYFGNAYDKYRSVLSLVNEVYAWNSIAGAMAPFTGAPFSGSGTFSLMDSGAQYGVSGTYYKNGKTVTIYGSFPTGSTAITSLPGLPFAPANSFEVMLPQYSMTSLTLVQCKLGFTASSTSVTTTGYVYGMSSSNASWINYSGRTALPFMVTYVTND